MRELPLAPEVPEDEDPRDLAALETWLTEGILAAMTEVSATLQDVTAAALKASFEKSLDNS